MMRKMIQKQLIELLDTVCEGILYAAALQGDTANSILSDCQSALRQVAQTILQNDTDGALFYQGAFRTIQNELRSSAGLERAQPLVTLIREIQDKLRQERALIEIVFLPYKLSMWDCMESVWRAASADPSCDCYVVPIPYYDRNPDQSFGTMRYEGAQFPKEIGAVDFRSYDLAARQPDIIYIHNPYDHMNLVTTVDPHYYSYELKKYTDMLIYIPYFAAGGTRNLVYSVYHWADYCIAQSHEMKRAMMDVNVPEDRILALGNPKFDAILNHAPSLFPEVWKDRLHNRKVFLVNTSLSDLLAHNEKWLKAIQTLLIALSDDEDCAVIWRPHPLMEATLQSMRPQELQFYQKMKRMLLTRGNFVLDCGGSFLPAFDASDAMVSDFSSMMWLYGATGKPVLCLTGNRAERLHAKYKTIDDSEFYFLQDGVSIEKFVSMIKKQQDPKGEQRIAALKASTINLDGSAGEKIHHTVLKCLQSRKG